MTEALIQTMWAHLGVFCGGLAQEKTSDPSLKFTLCCSTRQVAKGACVKRMEHSKKKKKHNTQLGSSGRGVGKPSTTSVCVIRQLRGLLVYRSTERNRVSKAKHWLAAFFNEIFSLTSTLNFLFFNSPHWLQLFITGSADDQTQWHLHWRKWPPGPINWPGTDLHHIATSSPMLLFSKDLTT